MPGKNRPKRLNRNISWRVARRKKRIAKLVSGGSRNRAPRPKKKKSVVSGEKRGLEKKEEKAVKKKAVKKVVKKE